VITRAPSAELAPNQTDQDDLPAYAVLDEIIRQYIDLGKSSEEIIAGGIEKKTVEKIIRRINQNEYKRRQAPPGVRISESAFGKDRRYPITSGF
jgi:NAD+ synthase (glutamine-hydrolysing)